MEIRSEVATWSGGCRSLDYQELKMSAEKFGVWEMKVDLRTHPGKFLSFPQYMNHYKSCPQLRELLQITSVDTFCKYAFRIHSSDL
jgi:hypothetical protein